MIMSRCSNVEIKDPIHRESMARRIAMRNICSVKITNLPNKCGYSDLLELVPDMVACRVYCDPVSRKSSSRAYIEFSSNEDALKCVNKLRNSIFQTKPLDVSIGGDLSESVGELPSFVYTLR